MTPCLLQDKPEHHGEEKKHPDYCLRRFFAPDNSPDEWYNQPHPAFLLIYYKGTSLLIYKARHYLCIKLALTYVQALTQLRYTRQPIPRSLGTGGRERLQSSQFNREVAHQRSLPFDGNTTGHLLAAVIDLSLIHI